MRASTRTLFLSLATVALLLVSCGEDRSGEQPFAPTVESVSVTTSGPIATLEGKVTASPNSTLLECGFIYGNDTLTLTISLEPQNHFYAQTDSLEAGQYYAVAFGRNYMGTSYGDTLTFQIP